MTSNDLLTEVDTIDVTGSVHKMDSMQVSTVTKLLFLDSDSLLIGKVSKLLFVDDLIIISDQPSDRFYGFDHTGQLLYYVEKPGYGPGEYQSIDDIGVDAERTAIEVLDLYGHRVLRYDLRTGEYLDYTKFDFYTKNLAPLPKDRRAFHNSMLTNATRGTKDSLNSGLFLTNNRNQIIRTFLPFEETGLDHIRLTTLENFFTNHLGTVNYVPLHGHSVYSIANDQLNLRYSIDFGDAELPVEFLLNFNEHWRQFRHRLYEANYAHSFSNFYETATHITFTFHVGREPRSAIYDKRTGKSLMTMPFFKDSLGFYIRPKAVFQEHHISVVDFETITYMKLLFESVATPDQLRSNMVYQHLVSTLAKSQTENPVLVFYRFKDIE